MFICMRMFGVRCIAHSLEGQRHEAETTPMFVHFCNFAMTLLRLRKAIRSACKS